MGADGDDDRRSRTGEDQYQLALSIEYRFIDRWGEDILKLGFTTVPNIILRINRYVPKPKQLGPSEVFVLMTILSYWWDSYRMPFPSISRISFETGMSGRNVKRVIKKLAEKDFIIIKKLNGPNIAKANQYDLSPIIDLMKRIAKHELAKGNINPKSRYRGVADLDR